jgi:putative phosphoesterase
MQIDQVSATITRIGIVTDTHIPDRARELPTNLLAKLHGVELILHAGDILQKKIVTELETIAPVLAVQGNRDFVTRYGRSLPLDRVIEIGAIRIGLTHGHGGWRGYLEEKIRYHTLGYISQRTVERAYARFENVQAVVFGHTHRPYNKIYNNVLMFNPGSTGPEFYTTYGSGLGLLTITPQGIRGEIVAVDEAPKD